MKITLVSLYSKTAFNQNYYSPLALQYLEAYANKELAGAVTIAVKKYTIQEAPNQIVYDLLKDRPDVIGFSCYIWNTNKILGLAYLLKKLNPALKIVLGGPQVTAKADITLIENEWVDVIVRGEGEQTFAELLKYYVHNDRRMEEITGITYRADAEVKSNEPRPVLANLDDIPSPFKEGLDDESSTILIETQRGCPFKCGFCSYHKNFKSIRQFSLERIKRDLKHLIDSGVKKLYLADPTFNLNPERAKEILRYIASINKNTVINTELRAELLDQETVDLLEGAGVTFLEIGLQSTNPVTLKAIGRATNFDKFESGINLLKKTKVKFVIQLIIGLPGDDLGTFKSSMDYVINLAPGTLQVFELQLLPGSALYDNAVEHGMLFTLAPPHLVVQNKTFSYSDMVKAKRLFEEAFIIYNLNFGILPKLTELRPSDLTEKWIAWKEEQMYRSPGDFEKSNSTGNSMGRLLLFSRFIKESLMQNSSSVLKNLSIRGKCNLLVLLIVYKTLTKLIRQHFISARFGEMIKKITYFRRRTGYIDPIEYINER